MKPETNLVRWLWVLLPILSGYAVFDFLAGVDTTGADKPGLSPLELAGPWAGILVPALSALLPSLAGLWAAIRARKWKKVAVSTFDAIEIGAKAYPQIKELKNGLRKAHEGAGVIGLVRAVVDKYGHK